MVSAGFPSDGFAPTIPATAVLPAVLPSVPSWLSSHLLPFFNSSPEDCLRAAIIGEAEGEVVDGKIAVGLVARNRLESGWWGGEDVYDINGILLAPDQFSCFWTDWEKRGFVMTQALNVVSAYPTAGVAAKAVLGGCEDFTDGSCFYFNPRVVLPSWASHLVKKITIPGPTGGHAFYGYI